MTDLRILIVGDNPLARTGLAALLAGEAGIAVVGQVAGGDDLPEDLDLYKPDILVWDLGWEPSSALDHLADLKDSGPPVVALLTETDHAADAWNAGAVGLLLRDTDPEQLLAALDAVSQGLAVLDPQLAAALPRSEPPTQPPAETLTPRELEVLQLLAEGLPNKTIARQLSISEHTVKFHLNAIMSKLGAQSRTEAVVRATRLGLIIL
jgi:DNA-binding NarL/FixJ family response regulator